MAQADQASRKVGEPLYSLIFLLFPNLFKHQCSSNLSWEMNVLQFTKHKSTSTLHGCDVNPAGMKLTAIIIYYGIILRHWALCFFHASVTYSVWGRQLKLPIYYILLVKLIV